MPVKIIDTHIHIWDFELAEYEWLKGNTSILNRTYSIEELAEERNTVGIAAGVLVQAANNFEDTDWMLRVASETSWIVGVVGWLPLMNPDATHKALAEKYKYDAYFKGVRHLIHDEPNAKWLLQKKVIESLQILAESNIPYDVVGIRSEHIETALQVAEKIPSLKMVFDHLNQPPIATKEKFGRWGELMNEAAKHPNFYMKISGLGTASGDFAGWTGDDIKPFIEFSLQTFGNDRCFCGGDWPVSLLAGSYTKTWTTYKSVLSSLLTAADQVKVFYENAKKFYNLNNLI